MQNLTSDSKLFNKVACFTDIHFGLKNNSRVHNEDCLNFIKWFIQTAKQNNCETCIFLGDWHHNRSTVNVTTINYIVAALKLLNESFTNVYIILGNHDLFYRDNRDLHSFPFANLHSNIKVIEDITEIGGVSLVPWLVQDEHKSISKINSKYVFGHFEIPNFFMNANIRMPKNGKIDIDTFQKIEMVFSGHFHMRQTINNITYIGNSFPHDFGDVDDNERGMMILEWGGTPQYHNWPDAPKYCKIMLSELVKEPSQYLNTNNYVKIILDVDITFEEMKQIKAMAFDVYKVRDVIIAQIPISSDDLVIEDGNAFKVDNIDNIFINFLSSIESETLDKDLLISIYNAIEI